MPPFHSTGLSAPCRRKLAHDNNISSVHVNFCAEEEVREVCENFLGVSK